MLLRTSNNSAFGTLGVHHIWEGGPAISLSFHLHPRVCVSACPMPCSIALDENLYLGQLHRVCRLSSSRLGWLWWWQQVGRSTLAGAWLGTDSALSQHGVCCNLGILFFFPFCLLVGFSYPSAVSQRGGIRNSRLSHLTMYRSTVVTLGSWPP